MTALRAPLPEADRPVGRVAVIAFHSSPLVEPGAGDAGGMTIYVRALAHALARSGVRTDIFTRAIGMARRVTEIAPGVRVVSIDAGPRSDVPKDELDGYVEEFIVGVRNFAIAQRTGYDVIHSHYWQSGLAARTLGDSWGVPVVHSHHTLGAVKNDSLAPGDRPEPQRRIEGEKAVIAGADVLVASTSEEMEQLACFYGAEHDNVTMIHPGVDHEAFSPGDRDAARAELDLGPEPVLLHVGRIQKLKGIDLAIRSLALLGPEVGEPILLVVGGPSGRGGGDELLRLGRLAMDLGVGHRVRFDGPQPHSNLPTYYRAADVVVVSSYSESFGLAALEAQACAIPVVATAVGGLKHIIQDGESGFLIDKRDAASFAAPISRLLRDDALWRRCSMAAAGASSAFSWDRAASEFVELYECLMSQEATEVCTC